MKKLFSIFAAIIVTAVFASTALAYNIRINVSGLNYEGHNLGGDMEYRMDGKIVGYAKNSGGTYIYTDANSNQVGSVVKVGTSWQFRGGDSTIIGYVEELGGRHIYKSGNSTIIGYAEKSGSNTNYKDGSNNSIGNADTDSLPFRPYPLELHLKKLKAVITANAVCLTRITKVNPGGAAEKAGMQVNDVIISFEGADWTIFDLMHSNYETTHTRVKEKFVSTHDKGCVMIAYRPAPGEKNQAKGQIVKISLPAGKKGFSYTSSENCTLYSQEKSKAYADQIKQIYQKWQ